MASFEDKVIKIEDIVKLRGEKWKGKMEKNRAQLEAPESQVNPRDEIIENRTIIWNSLKQRFLTLKIEEKPEEISPLFLRNKLPKLSEDLDNFLREIEFLIEEWNKDYWAKFRKWEVIKNDEGMEKAEEAEEVFGLSLKEEEIQIGKLFDIEKNAEPINQKVKNILEKIKE